MSSWISNLEQMLVRVDAARLIDAALLTGVILAMALNVWAAILASRGSRLLVRPSRRASGRADTLIFPAVPQLLLLSCIFVPLGLFLAHQHLYAWARWQTSSHLGWLWIIVSFVWLLIPLLAWPGSLVLEDRGIRQSGLLPEDKYIAYDEIAEIRWRQLSILVISKSGQKIVHTQAHSTRTLFEDEMVARTDPKTTTFHWED